MNKSTKIIVGIIIIILIVIVYEHTKKAPINAPIKIGVATILSGDFAALGENIVNTAKLEVNDINKAGGIDGQSVELVVEDAGVDSKTGLSAIQKLVNIDGVKYIIGGMSSNGTIASAPVANQAHAIIMTPVTGGSNVDAAGEYVFRTANSDILAGRDLANAMIKLGYKNVGVVAEVTDYTLDIKNTFEKTIQQDGGTVVSSEEFQSNVTDYRTLIAKVQATHPQALLVLSQLGTDAALFIKQSREAGFNPPLFTDFTLATNDNAKKIAGSFDGIYFANPAYDATGPATVAFFKEFQTVYNKSPLIPFHSASTVDSINMLVKGIEAVGDDSTKVHDWLLSNIKNYHGLMGTYSLDQNGNSNLGFVIDQIQGDKIIEIK